MSRIIESLSDVQSRYEALFCDLWGCVHDGLRPFPAAVRALQSYRAAGGKVVLVTNSPRPRASDPEPIRRASAGTAIRGVAHGPAFGLGIRSNARTDQQPTAHGPGKRGASAPRPRRACAVAEIGPGATPRLQDW